MLNATEAVFPNNVVLLMAVAFESIDPDLTILKRPLRPTDPNQSIGIFGSLWDPDDQSLEIGHRFLGEPTLSRYQIGVQALVKDGDEERGLATHSVFSKRIRSVLYRNQALSVALAGLYVSDDSSREAVSRWGIRTQRYMNNDVEGKFVYLSTLDYWIETETS